MLDGVSRSYGHREVLSRLTGQLSAGQVLGLLGPNGAGKTTLLSIMACVLAPTQGQVVVDGMPVANETDARAARRLIGFLPQSPAWVPSFTALETVQYSAWLKGVPSRDQDALAREALALVGLTDQAARRMRQLSGGMIQRVNLAAALVARPKILLLDEPTVGLDPAQRLEFRALIGSFGDTAVVLSTHLVEDVAVLATDVMVLNEGVVRFTGPPAQLASAGAPDARGDTPLERGYMSVLAPDLVGSGAR
ncbi:MAG: ATP-binding cassette domain-containing protein [Bifidobacteriaceae bacterium]|jgi:ABC-2 type transport system ATP-binding protein|nr:ATP-binding cassette domain-containing protein [Bifidobacteriaceae bacterium]